MCGICGWVEHQSGSISEARVRSMADRMAHRGPDDAGFYYDKVSLPEAALAHRRLSIIDLSSHGHQPMSNENGTIWIVLNGEIYNYKELKFDLEKKGHRFASNTDTETVVHLYEEYGEECVKYLRGMFAFAIWDANKKYLLAARDRAGKKPLLYYHDGGTLCFASEFAALLESGVIKNDINHESIHYYLTFGYIPAPLTVYRKVLKLPPAHILTFRNNKIAIKRYWELDYSKKLNITETDAAAETLNLLREAVKIRLRSDVPLGAFLSGGIDSSAVVGLMSEQAFGQVKTFSIGFEDKDYDELAHARRIAGRFGTEHHEFVVKPDALGILPLLVERYGEPYADSSSIPTYYVCRETRKFVTVALNGDGGDELFAGYERYQAMLASQIYQKLPDITKRGIEFVIGALPDSVRAKNNIRKVKRFFDGVALPDAARYLRWLSIFGEKLKKDLYAEEYTRNFTNNDPVGFIAPYISDKKAPDLIDRLLMADTNLYLPDDLLVKVDIASMANSLEARSPFLDHKLMEFAASLPGQYKMKNFVKKHILKKALNGLIPGENLHRKKMGFGMPVGAWLRGELKDLMSDTILSKSSFSSTHFKEEIVRNMIEEHLRKKRDYAPQLWALLMLELWHKQYIVR